MGMKRTSRNRYSHQRNLLMVAAVGINMQGCGSETPGRCHKSGQQGTRFIGNKLIGNKLIGTNSLGNQFTWGPTARYQLTGNQFTGEPTRLAPMESIGSTQINPNLIDFSCSNI